MFKINMNKYTIINDKNFIILFCFFVNYQVILDFDHIEAIGQYNVLILLINDFFIFFIIFILMNFIITNEYDNLIFLLLLTFILLT